MEVNIKHYCNVKRSTYLFVSYAVRRLWTAATGYVTQHNGNTAVLWGLSSPIIPSNILRFTIFHIKYTMNFKYQGTWINFTFIIQLKLRHTHLQQQHTVWILRRPTIPYSTSNTHVLYMNYLHLQVREIQTIQLQHDEQYKWRRWQKFYQIRISHVLQDTSETG
jgi:hypothetical protein